MSEDKELVEVWQSEFESIGDLESFNFSKDDFGRYTSSLTDGRWQGFILAKRLQPIVVLPKPLICYHTNGQVDEVYSIEQLTAAGIKYTIGE